MEDHLSKDEKKKVRQEEWQIKLQKEQRKKLVSKIVWWGGAAVLLIFSVWFLITIVNSSSSGNGPTTVTTINVPSVTAADMTLGPKDAKVVLVEYADFQCPGCGAAYPLLKQLTNDYKGRLLFVYRFMPLESIHQHALLSAQASYAAYKQGKFWEMHDTLFSHQADWADSPNAQALFEGYATKLGLNVSQFIKDMNDPKTITYIKSQEQKGIEIGIQATPTMFLNGKQIQNVNTYNDLKQLVNKALNANP